MEILIHFPNNYDGGEFDTLWNHPFLYRWKLVQCNKKTTEQ